MQEEVWQNAEVDALYRLAAAGVKVPKPYICFEGVLLMDLLTDASGNAAPRLNDVEMSESMALDYHAQLPHQCIVGDFRDNAANHRFCKMRVIKNFLRNLR